MKKKKTVQVSIETAESSGEMPPYETSAMLEGELEKKGSGYVLSYLERVTDDAGSPDMTRVRLHISEHRVMMMREGGYSTMMVFDRHQPYEGMYKTPFGELPIHIQTVKVENRCYETEGKVHMEYEMSVSGWRSSYRIVNIEYYLEEEYEEPSE